MKFSLCSIGDRETDIETVITRTAQLGYKGIELYEPHIRRFIEQGNDIELLSGLLHKHLLAVSVVSSYATFLGSDEIYRQTIAHFNCNVLPWAKSLQAVPIRILMDWVGSDKASAEERLRIVRGLREIAKLAAADGIMILLETHLDQLTDSTDTTLRFIEDVGMENVRVNLDIYNLFQIGENPLHALDRLFPYTSNIHLKSGILVDGKVSYGIRLKEGDMNFIPFLKELQKKAYVEYLGVEWFGDHFWEAADHELTWVKSITQGKRAIIR